MISDEVRHGIVAKDSMYWFSTVAGIMAFDYKMKRFYSFESENKAKLFNYRIFTDAYGNISQNLYPDYIINIDTNIIKTQELNGHIYLKETKLFGKTIPSDTIYDFNFNQNNLILSFGYLDQNTPISPELEYCVNGQNWQAVEKMDISMYNMMPGGYTLQVRPRYQPSGLITLKIRIDPPWYQTWWFYLIILSMLSVFTFLAYKLRISNIRKEEKEKNQLKERIAQIEMSALRAQMNPHFIFNCLNSINRFILVNDTEAASEYLTKFSRLIRMILDASREDFISLEKEIASLRLYIGMESMRFQESFEWSITIDEDVYSHNIMLPPLLIQPYVENAIWHGLMQAPEGWGVRKLAIHVYSQGEAVIIKIEDNGIGRDKAKLLKSKTGDQHKSYGISLTEERLKLMQKIQGTMTEIVIEDLFNKQGSPCGTIVKIILNQ
ncbi:MAG: histidine kinase [Saprospiraceae bacterium]|nr:histidine kinase [Saprospiraceae bacterium]